MRGIFFLLLEVTLGTIPGAITIIWLVGWLVSITRSTRNARRYAIIWCLDCWCKKNHFYSFMSHISRWVAAYGGDVGRSSKKAIAIHGSVVFAASCQSLWIGDFQRHFFCRFVVRDLRRKKTKQTCLSTYRTITSGPFFLTLDPLIKNSEGVCDLTF